MSRIKFGVIGCGSIGQRHLALIQADPGAELVAICDIDVQQCKKFSEQYKVPYDTDFMLLLERKDVQAVSICTPHALHASMSMAAAQHQKHVLVEKPMALYEADCKTMIETADENKVKITVVKQNRHNVPVALTKKAIDEGRLGKVYMVQCSVMWNRGDDYYKAAPWRGRKKDSGGALYTQASHFIDLMIWLLGDISESKAIIDTLHHQIEIEDSGVAALKFTSGALGSLLWTTCVHNNNYEGSVTIVAEKGTIKIGGQYLNKIDYWDVQDYPLPDNISFGDKPNNYERYQGSSSNHDKVIRQFVEELQSGSIKNKDNAAMQTVAAIEMIYKEAGA